MVNRDINTKLKKMLNTPYCNRWFLVFLLSVLFVPPVFAKNKKKDKKEKSVVMQDSTKIHSPFRAMVYSAVLPGLGQAYNKKYWKIPIVYAGIGIPFYTAIWNSSHYNDYQDGYVDYNAYLEYKYQSPDGGLPIPKPANERYKKILDEDFDNFTKEQDDWFIDVLLDRQDNFKRDRDLSYILMGVFYLLNIIDATVDAHLMDFDVSEDLSMKVQPSLQTIDFTQQTNIGLSLTVNF